MVAIFANTGMVAVYATAPLGENCVIVLHLEVCGRVPYRYFLDARSDAVAAAERVWRKDHAVDTNPFEDEDGRYIVLINDEGQHSLWPVLIDVPEGWTVIFEEDSRQACLDFIEKNWTDMRPNSLIEEMRKYESQNGRGRGSSSRKGGKVTVAAGGGASG